LPDRTPNSSTGGYAPQRSDPYSTQGSQRNKANS
jgi:hypothetical protein